MISVTSSLSSTSTLEVLPEHELTNKAASPKKPSLLAYEFKANPIRACLVSASIAGALYFTATGITNLVSWLIEEPIIEPVEEILEPTLFERSWNWIKEQAYEYWSDQPVVNTTKTLSTLTILTYYAFPKLLNPVIQIVQPRLVHQVGEENVNSLGQYLKAYIMPGLLFGLATQFYNYFGSRPKWPDIELPAFYGGGGKLTFPSMDTKAFQKSLEGFFEWLEAKYVQITLGVGQAGIKVFTVGTGLSIAAHYIKKKMELALTRPVLSRKYQFYDWEGLLAKFTEHPTLALKEFICGEEPKQLTKPILALDVQEQLDEIIRSFQIIQENKGTFPNVLLYGPPGTGKSMSAEYIAQSCGMNYVTLSGGDIAKYIGSSTSPVEQLNLIFERMNHTLLPTLLFIDEFDALASDRSHLDAPRIELLNTFLNLTGTPSNKVIIIGATNRLEELDSAAANRFDDKLYLGPPSDQERLDILKMYVAKFFNAPEDEGLFTEPYLDHLTQILKGQVGRTLYKLINKCYLKKMQSAGRRMTQEEIDRVIQRFFENEALEKSLLKKHKL